ncbi:hypothetical protein CRENBAI_006342, partial [Crenichthys baileyi]
MASTFLSAPSGKVDFCVEVLGDSALESRKNPINFFSETNIQHKGRSCVRLSNGSVHVLSLGGYDCELISSSLAESPPFVWCTFATSKTPVNSSSVSHYLYPDVRALATLAAVVDQDLDTGVFTRSTENRQHPDSTSSARPTASAKSATPADPLQQHSLKDEHTDAFIERVTEVVTKYSGVQKPTDVGQESGAWKTLVCDVVIKGLLPHVAQPLKATYVGWAEQPRLSDVRRYARYAQRMAEEQKKIKKDKSEKELHLAAITMYQHVTKSGGGRDQGRLKQWKGCGRGRNPETCYNCGQKGHWQDDCPHPTTAPPYKADLSEAGAL